MKLRLLDCQMVVYVTPALHATQLRNIHILCQEESIIRSDYYGNVVESILRAMYYVPATKNIQKNNV